MSVSFKAKLLSAITNAAYISKTTADIALAKLGLSDSNPSNNSGAAIDNTQKFINQLADSSGETENDANRKIYSSNNFISDGDSRKVAIGKLDAQSLVNADGIQAINDSIGQPDGIAPLDSSGLVPAANLPSYVDDVEEYADLASFPVTGETGKIYVALDTGRIYRWSGSIYVEISQSPVDSVNGQTGTVVLDNTDIGLGNVTNDAQLKRDGADFDTFTEKVTPVVDDIVLIEDSEDSFNKKKAKLSNLLGGGGGGGLDTYYTNDFESFLVSDIQETGNGAYASNLGGFGGVISVDTVDIIAGDQSFRYTAGATSNGDYFIIDSVNIRDREKSVSNARSIWIDASNFNNDFNIIIYDQSNSSVLKSQTVLAGTPLKEYLIEFVPASTTDIINFGFEMPTAVDTEYFVWDNIEFTVDPFVYASVGTTTNPIDAGPINITATVSAPTKGVVVEDRVIWHREGKFAVIRYTYYQSSAAGATPGSGSYLFEIPSEIGQVDTSLITPYSSPTSGGMTIDAQMSKIGSGAAFSNTGPSKGISWEAHLYDENHFRIYTFVAFNNQSYMDDNFFFLNQNALSFEMTIKVPIVGWSASSDNAVIPSKSNMFDTKIVQGITIEGVTTNPTKGTTAIDQIEYSQVGDKGVFSYRYAASTSGTAGSGNYLYTLPDGLEFSDSVLKTTASLTNMASADVAAYTLQGCSGYFTITGTSSGDAIIIPYDSTRFRVGAKSLYNSTGINGSSYFALSQANLSFSLNFYAPIKGWTSENQFLSLIPVQKTAYLKDVKPSGTAGGTFTAGSYVTRDLNTAEGDSDIVSLNANQFTLQPGTYRVSAYVPAFYVDIHKAKLRDVTNSLDVSLGSDVISGSVNARGNTTISIINTSITIASQTSFEIQHRCQTTRSTDGFGAANVFGDENTYTVVKITKVK